MNKKRNIIIVIGILFVVIWILGIYKLSSMNTSNSNGKSTNIISIFIEDTLEVTNKYGITSSHPNNSKLDRASSLLNKPLRKVIHATVYFVLAFVIIFIVNLFFDNKKYIVSSIITIILSLIFASLDEYHQTFVVSRDGSFWDCIIDTLGAGLACFIYVLHHTTKGA